MSTSRWEERQGSSCDINCDLGEGVGDDAAVMPFVSTASIACGGHAGDAATMRATIAAARAAYVTIGAHPSYPDRQNFGRRALVMTPAEIEGEVIAQVSALMALARPMGVRLGHVKPHGALYHVAGSDPAVAAAFARAVRALGAHLVVVGPPGSQLAVSAARHRLRFVGEIFADRGYGDDGRLLPREQPGALITLDPEAAAARAVAMVKGGVVFTAAGATLPQVGRTLCLHGDDPAVVERARALRAAFDRAGIAVRALAVSL